MPTTGQSGGRLRKGGSELQALAPVIDPALESITVATPAMAIGTLARAAADVPIAPELLMQGAEAQTASASVQTAGAVQARVNEDEGSEWEYDWDDCETHYITLDLTIPQPLFPHLAPTTVLPSVASTSTTTASKGKKPANKSATAAAVDDDDDDDNNTSTNKNKPIKQTPTTTQYPTKFQLQALSSPTPLVSYHNRIFSCDWTIPLGSEIFITSKEKSSGEDARVEIVGVGQARLHGHPAIVTARSRTEDHRATRTDVPGKGEGQLAAGKGGMGGRTAFWKRLEEVKRRKKEEASGPVNPAEGDRRDGEDGGEREGEGETEMEGAETDFAEEGLERIRGSSSRGGKGVGRGRGRRKKEVIGHEQEIRQLEEMERDLDLEEMSLDAGVNEDDEDEDNDEDDEDEYGEDEDEEAERMEIEWRRKERRQEGEDIEMSGLTPPAGP